MAPNKLVQSANIAPIVTIHLTVIQSIFSNTEGNGASASLKYYLFTAHVIILNELNLM